MRYASLPMYGEQELHPAIEQWWAGIARHLRDRGIGAVPDALSWPDDLYALWRSPDLLFGQTCGHPLVHTLLRSLTIVATPHYDAPGCDGPHYRSLVLVGEDTAARSVGELREKSLAVSSTDSYSGYHVWRRILSGSRGATDMFGAIVLTGSHRASIRSVREGQAEVCAVRLRHACVAERPDARRAGGHAHSGPLAAGAGAALHHRCGDDAGRARAASRRTVRGAGRSAPGGRRAPRFASPARPS